MAYVDDFLLQQIFVRLPVKSVHRFKCVSKHWLSLISDMYFAHQYVQFQSSRANVDEGDATTFIYMETSGRIPKCLDFPSSDAFEFEVFSFDFIPAKFQQLSLKLLAASHGWILCSSESSNSCTRLYCGWEIDYHLCSPLSKQWIDIPRPPKPETEIDMLIDKSCSVGLVCEDDDLISSFSRISNNGFAVKPFQFKVVKILNNPSEFFVFIFSSENWEWSTSRINNYACRLSYNYWKPCMVSCDGTLYWTTRIHTCLFALDLRNGAGDAGKPLRCRQIRLPPTGGNISNSSVQLGYCNGKIHLSHMDEQVGDGRDAGGGNILSIWQLIEEGRRDGYRWIIKAREGWDFSFYAVKMVKFDPLDKDIVYVVLSTKQVLRLNLVNNTLTKIDCDDSIANGVTFVLPYWPVLQSPRLPAR